MRSIIILALLLPLLATSQINRSARELASEQVQEYVTHKLFKNNTYKPVSFGEIKPFKDKTDLDIAWTIVHTFVIKTSLKNFDDKEGAPKEYKFMFYLDEKMQVVRAESYFTY